MSAKPEEKTMVQRSEILRLGRWLGNPRNWRIILFVVASLATVVFLIYGVINWRGKRAWTKTKAELTAMGEKLDLADFVPPPVPDDQNFTMTPFLAPLFDFKPGTQEWQDPDAVKRIQEFDENFARALNASKDAGSWRLGTSTELGSLAGQLDPTVDTNDVAASATAVLKALQEYQPILTELRQASQRPHARFNIRYEEECPAGILLPHLRVIKGLARLAATGASAELILDQPDAAYQDLQLGLDIMDTIKDEPILISYLVRCAAWNLLAQPFWEGLARHQWTEPQLLELQTRLANLNFWEKASRSMRAERAFGNGIMDWVRTQPEKLGYLGNFSGSEAEMTPWYIHVAVKFIPRGWFYQEQANYNRLYQELLLSLPAVATQQVDPKGLQASSDQYEKELEGNPWQRFWNHNIISGLLLPALQRAWKVAVKAEAVADQASLACALERYRLAHNQFPKSLEDLLPQYLKELPRDIIRGGPLHYRPTPGGGYVLYSIGWNMADDGGQPGRNEKGRWDPDAGDWVWICPAKVPGNGVAQE